MDGAFLKELADFSDLRRRYQDFNSLSSKQSSAGFGVDLDMQSNEVIIKSFRQLRDKLKAVQRECSNLRQQSKALQVQNLQLRESENNLRGINHQLKQKNCQYQQNNDQLRKRITIMKQSLSQKSSTEEHLQFMKSNVMQYQIKCEKLEDEKKKLIEISIEDKLNLEDKMNKILFKSSSDDKYIKEIEGGFSKAKETILKLQNQIKKMQIRYDEETFNKKWSKENFHKEHLQAQLKELQQVIVQLKNKNKKEKDKRIELEKRVIQLEQIAGLWNVKAETFEGQADMMSKKIKKMQRRVTQARSSVNKIAIEKISWEERFVKSVGICEELINRVKRQLIGDAVELAKTCQFRINKLKQGKDSDIPRLSAGKQIVNTIKKSQKNTKRNRKSNEKQFFTATKNTQSHGVINYEYQKKGILTEAKTNVKISFESEKKSTLQDGFQCGKGNQQNQGAMIKQYSSLQQKIRKQREQMQKKLKQRMLYRKIEICNSPDKSKLRQDYLKLIFQK